MICLGLGKNLVVCATLLLLIVASANSSHQADASLVPLLRAHRTTEDIGTHVPSESRVDSRPNNASKHQRDNLHESRYHSKEAGGRFLVLGEVRITDTSRMKGDMFEHRRRSGGFCKARCPKRGWKRKKCLKRCRNNKNKKKKKKKEKLWKPKNNPPRYSFCNDVCTDPAPYCNHRRYNKQVCYQMQYNCGCWTPGRLTDDEAWYKCEEYCKDPNLCSDIFWSHGTRRCAQFEVICKCPTSFPTHTPTKIPTSGPTTSPPSVLPTPVIFNFITGDGRTPSASPSAFPSSAPIAIPSTIPTTAPASSPSSAPISRPSAFPTQSKSPTYVPSSIPTVSNDLCPNAEEILYDEIVVGSTNSPATIDNVMAYNIDGVFDPTQFNGCKENNNGDGPFVQITAPGVWYTFVAGDDNEMAIAAACNDDRDSTGVVSWFTKFSVYTGTCDRLVCVTAASPKEGICDGAGILLDIPTKRNFGYYILVHSYQGYSINQFKMALFGKTNAPSVEPSNTFVASSAPTSCSDIEEEEFFFTIDFELDNFCGTADELLGLQADEKSALGQGILSFLTKNETCQSVDDGLDIDECGEDYVYEIATIQSFTPAEACTKDDSIGPLRRQLRRFKKSRGRAGGRGKCRKCRRKNKKRRGRMRLLTDESTKPIHLGKVDISHRRAQGDLLCPKAPDLAEEFVATGFTGLKNVTEANAEELNDDVDCSVFGLCNLTSQPTLSPTAVPTKGPSSSPTLSPTAVPTNGPSPSPTKGPSPSPTKSPTFSPTKAPTKEPTSSPSKLTISTTATAYEAIDQYLCGNRASVESIYGPFRNWTFGSISLQSAFLSGRGDCNESAYTTFNDPIDGWQVSQVTDMSVMFENAAAFNQPLENWDTSNVETMRSMFSHAAAFNQLIGGWDVTKVTDMSSMFINAAFNKFLDQWIVSEVTDMSSMFVGAAFNNPIDQWDVSKVTDMSLMFKNAVFDQPIDQWNVSEVVDMSSMFAGAAFNQPIYQWDVSKVTDMSSMFENAAFNNAFNIDQWNVSEVTDMSSMFLSAAFNQNLCSWSDGMLTTPSVFPNVALMFAETSCSNTTDPDASLLVVSPLCFNCPP